MEDKRTERQQTEGQQTEGQQTENAHSHTHQKRTFFKRENYPILSEGFGIFGFLILFSLVFGVIMYIPKSIFVNMPESMGSLLDLIAYTAGFLMVLFLIFKKVNKTEFWESMNPAKVKNAIYLLIIPISFSTTFLTEPLVSWLPMPDIMVDVFKNLIKFNPFSIAMIVIFAPILEEIVFRGIILKGFLKNYSPTKAIIWSAVLFGLVHMNPWQFIGATSIGLVIGWLYWQTGSVIPGILLHLINNLTATMGYYYANDIEQTSREWINDDNIYFSIYLAGIIILALSYVFIKNLYAEKQSHRAS